MNLERLRDLAHEHCARANIAVYPYGNAWWLVGHQLNQVVGEIAGLSPAALEQMRRPITARR